MNLHYYQILYCKFSYLLRFTCNPKSNTCSTLMVIPGHVHAQNSRNCESANTLLSSWGWTPDVLPSCFSSHAVNEHPFHSIYSAVFFTFWCFLLVMSLFKVASSVLLKYYQVFLSVGGPLCALWKKYMCEISFFQAWVIELLVMSSMLMIQQYILSKVSLNRHTHRTRLYVEWLIKMLWHFYVTGT